MADKKTEQKTYELVGEWLDDYHSSSDKYKKARAKALMTLLKIWFRRVLLGY